jgi:D-alanine transaminase
MYNIAYVNGRYLPRTQAVVGIEDRGFQFADGVYEVIHARDGVLVDVAWHLDRLDYSLNELRIAAPCSRKVLLHIMQQLLYRNRIQFGSIYLQITRGEAKRDFPFPKEVKPTLVITAQKIKEFSSAFIEKGVKVIVVPDARWQRCDIKSIALLAPVLAKQAAIEAGAFEAWQVDTQGYITEGASTNAWIIKDRYLITRAPDYHILNGITRQRLLVLAKKIGLEYIERSFTLHEALQADEAFLSSTTTYLLPVVQINDSVIAGGKPGVHSLKLRTVYSDFCKEHI